MKDTPFQAGRTRGTAVPGSDLPLCALALAALEALQDTSMTRSQRMRDTSVTRIAHSPSPHLRRRNPEIATGAPRVLPASSRN